MVHPYLRRREGRSRVTYARAVKKVLRHDGGSIARTGEAARVGGAGLHPARRTCGCDAAWKRRGGIEPCREKLITASRGNARLPPDLQQIPASAVRFRVACGEFACWCTVYSGSRHEPPRCVRCEKASPRFYSSSSIVQTRGGMGGARRWMSWRACGFTSNLPPPGRQGVERGVGGAGRGSRSPGLGQVKGSALGSDGVRSAARAPSSRPKSRGRAKLDRGDLAQSPPRCLAASPDIACCAWETLGVEIPPLATTRWRSQARSRNRRKRRDRRDYAGPRITYDAIPGDAAQAHRPQAHRSPPRSRFAQRH